MSDTENKLLERIASLESRLSGKDKETSGLDKRKATLDPVKYFQEQGLDIAHLSRHFVAHALGKECPPQLAAMVQMGPQIAATSHLEELVTSLSQKVDSMLEKEKSREVVASVKSTTVDSAKYPTLAAAMKSDPKFLEMELASLGELADTASALEKIEKKISPYAKAFGFKSSTDTSQNKSESGTITETTPEFKSANNGLSGTEVPPLVNLAPGAWSEDDHIKVKEAILKKYNSNT